MLQDLAVLTGGRAVGEEVGIRIEYLTLEQPGSAKRVVVDHDTTTIVEAPAPRRPSKGAAGSCDG